MNIVIVNDFAYVNGGTAQVALSSALGLAEAGHRVTLLTAVGPFDKKYSHHNIQVVCTGQFEIVQDPNRARAALQGIWNPVASHAMKTLLQDMDRQNTIVHLHGWTKALSSSVIQAAVTRGFKVIATLHEYFSACPNGGFFIYPTKQICHLLAMSAQCVRTNCDPRSYSQKLWRVARQTVQQRAGAFPSGVHHFITISDLSESVLKQYLPSDAVFYRIPNPTSATDEGLVTVRDNDAFIFIGRLAPEKGGHFFADAASALQVKAIFVGDGPERDTIARTLPNATITGWVTNSEVKAAMKHARALVLPSLWYEGQPLVVGDAAALGIPAIVPDTCAARETVRNGITGLWFKGGSREDLINKIRVLQTDNVAERMGMAAYKEFWKAPFTIQKHVGALEAAYSKMLINFV